MPRHRRRTKKYMRGGEIQSFDPIRKLQERAEDAHAQIKASASQASQHVKTMPSVDDFNNGINNFAQHATNMNNSMANLGPDIANATRENRDNMMNSVKEGIAHTNQGNYVDAVKSVDQAKSHMTNSINDAASHITNKKPLSSADLGDHASAITDKMQKSVSQLQGQAKNLFSRFSNPTNTGGGYTRKRKQKDTNYNKRRYEISSSHRKYSKYHNRLLKHKTKRR